MRKSLKVVNSQTFTTLRGAMGSHLWVRATSPPSALCGVLTLRSDSYIMLCICHFSNTVQFLCNGSVSSTIYSVQKVSGLESTANMYVDLYIRYFCRTAGCQFPRAFLLGGNPTNTIIRMCSMSNRRLPAMNFPLIAIACVDQELNNLEEPHCLLNAHTLLSPAHCCSPYLYFHK